MNKSIKNMLWWIGIFALQLIMVFYFRPTLVYTPYFYLLLVFRLQASFSQVSLLVIGFLSGLVMDAFTNSWGVHSFSALITVALIPILMSLISQQTLSQELKFSSRQIGSIRYAIITFFLFLVYHTTAFFLWSFSINQGLEILWKSIITSTTSMIIGFLFENIAQVEKAEENG